MEKGAGDKNLIFIVRKLYPSVSFSFHCLKLIQWIVCFLVLYLFVVPTQSLLMIGHVLTDLQ